MNKNCFNCDQKGTSLFGYVICDSCNKNLRLFTEKTIERHISKFTKPAYLKEMENKLINLEKDFIKKKIKLLDALAKANK